MKPAFLITYAGEKIADKVVVFVDDSFKEGVDDPYGDKVPISVGSNQTIRECAEGVFSPVGSPAFQLLEAGACIWEWALEQKLKQPSERSPHVQKLIEWWEEVGTAEARAELISLCTLVEEAYRTAVEYDGYDDCFDWEFVPWFMENKVLFNTLRHTPSCQQPQPQNAQ